MKSLDKFGEPESLNLIRATVKQLADKDQAMTRILHPNSSDLFDGKMPKSVIFESFKGLENVCLFLYRSRAVIDNSELK